MEISCLDSVEKIPSPMKVLATCLKDLVDRKISPFFVAPKLLDAVKCTDFKDPIDFSTLPLPFESGVFVLPRGALVHPTDGDAGAIIWSRTVAGKDFVLPVPRWVKENPNTELAEAWRKQYERKITCDTGGLGLVALCPDTGYWYDLTYLADGSLLNLKNPFDLADQPTPQSPFDTPLREQDGEFLQKMVSIFFGVIMAMLARPTLLEKECRVATTKKKREREFWSPNVVGKYYQPVHQKGDGTHSSPRMHWRRGHYRNQAHGEGRKERKILWIEPMLISAK
jgi:hypothetical protein